jgi:hypothetical protein
VTPPDVEEKAAHMTRTEADVLGLNIGDIERTFVDQFKHARDHR